MDSLPRVHLQAELNERICSTQKYDKFGYKNALNICLNSIVPVWKDMFSFCVTWRPLCRTTMRSNDPLGGPRWRSRPRSSYSVAVARIGAELSAAVAAADNATNADNGNNDIEAHPSANNRGRACGVIGATTHGAATGEGGCSGGSHWRSRSRSSYSLAVARIGAELSAAVAAADNAISSSAGTGNNDIDETHPIIANNSARACGVIVGAARQGEERNGEGSRSSVVTPARLGSRIHAPATRELLGEEVLLHSSPAPRQSRQAFRPHAVDTTTGEPRNCRLQGSPVRLKPCLHGAYRVVSSPAAIEVAQGVREGCTLLQVRVLSYFCQRNLSLQWHQVAIVGHCRLCLDNGASSS